MKKKKKKKKHPQGAGDHRWAGGWARTTLINAILRIMAPRSYASLPALTGGRQAMGDPTGLRGQNHPPLPGVSTRQPRFQAQGRAAAWSGDNLLWWMKTRLVTCAVDGLTAGRPAAERLAAGGDVISLPSWAPGQVPPIYQQRALAGGRPSRGWFRQARRRPHHHPAHASMRTNPDLGPAARLNTTTSISCLWPTRRAGGWP